MYVPPAFAEHDLGVLHDFIARHSFATVITQHDGEPFASHVPLLLDRTAGPRGTLRGHLARANPQAGTADGEAVLAIFHGPHVYVSPTWYAATNVVPTWNYVVVHAAGRWRTIDDGPRLRQLLRETVDTYERHLPQPWSMDSQDPAFVDRMAQAIVGFEFEIDRLEGKWKLNQNQPTERQQRVITALQDQADPDAAAVAKLMSAITLPVAL